MSLLTAIDINASGLTAQRQRAEVTSANIANAHKVKRVIANGRLYELHELVNGPSPAGH